MVRLARAVCCTLAACALQAALAADTLPQPVPAAPASQVQLARALLADLVAAQSTSANGTARAARLLAERLLAAGFGAQDVQVLAPANAPNKPNVVVRLKGRGKGKPLLYLGHLDVVEARRADWNFDPFALTEHDGWLYGRGTIDMLGQDAAMASALIRFKQEGVVPARDIIVAFTADEEGGNANGVEWLLKEHRELVDAGLVINPDGGEAAVKNERQLYIGMQTSEKAYMTFHAEAVDKGGHSSRPTRHNPIYQLSIALARLSAHQFPFHLTDTTRLYFAGRSALEQGQAKADMRMLGSGKLNPVAIGHLSEDVETNILLRTTCVATGIEGGHAENALPQRARATIQCRVMPGETQQETEATLRRVLADPDIRLSATAAARPSVETKPDSAVIAALDRVIKTMWPGVPVLPQMSAGATDSVHTRAAGMPTFGIDAMFDDLDDGRAHGRDERIGVKVFEQELEFTYRLMKELSGE